MSMKRATRIILAVALVVAPIAGVARANGPDAAPAQDPPCCLLDDLADLVNLARSLIEVEEESLCAYYRTSPGGPQHGACAPMQVSALACPHIGRICEPPPGSITASDRH